MQRLRDCENIEHRKHRFIVLESDSSRARAPHRYKIVIGAHTFSPWYCKAKEADFATLIWPLSLV